jgi:DNA mismatch endonuclease (patch repair protein)
VNGCFWHRHEGCPKASLPKSNRLFWAKKFRENVRRDKANYAKLKVLGWRVVVIWQCDVTSPERAAVKLKRHFRGLPRSGRVRTESFSRTIDPNT